MVSILLYFKMYFIPVMVKLNLQHHYSSLQCHMIFQSFSLMNTIFLKTAFI